MTPTPLRFLALGDSYTIGEGVAPEARWPVQLVAALQAGGQTWAEPQIIARTGWTTAELAAGIAAADPQGPYDLVSLLIGVNNQYRGYDLAEYRGEFRQLLAQAIEFAGDDPERVVVLSIPDWGATPFAAGRDQALIAADIDAFNAVNRRESQAAGVHYLDITPLSRQVASQPDLLAGDGLHLSGDMYALWVAELLPVLQGIQDVYGYIPEETVFLAAERLNVYSSQIYGVLTFYAQFHLEPRGKYIIRICMGTACHVKGAVRIGDTIADRLGIGHAETTEDLLFTVEHVACIGACGMAPVIMVNDGTYGSLTVQKTNEVIDKYKELG